jgi:hypothetical protein
MPCGCTCALAAAQERAAALEALATIQDSGVLLGNVQPEHILVQRTQVQSGRSCRVWQTYGALLYRHNEGPSLLPRQYPPTGTPPSLARPACEPCTAVSVVCLLMPAVVGNEAVERYASRTVATTSLHALAQDGYGQDRVRWVGFRRGMVAAGLSRTSAAACEQREAAEAAMLQQLRTAAAPGKPARTLPARCRRGSTTSSDTTV